MGRNVQVYDKVRVVHLERATDSPARWQVVYRQASYDFDDSLAAQIGAVPLGRLRTAVFLYRTDAEVIELNEPAMVTAWPSLILYRLALAARSARRKRPVVVAQAIENMDVAHALANKTRLPLGLTKAPTRAVLRFIVAGYDRIAFSTAGAHLNYTTMLGSHSFRPDVIVLDPIEPPCTCGEHRQTPGRVVFVGSLEPRKGLPELMRAWDALHQDGAVPGRHLTILGMGPMASTVQEWANRRDDVSVQLHPTRSDIHAALSAAQCAVLLSQRSRTWREQIGLPILEALSHGCAVLTTEETGVADWLRDTGHQVVPSDAPTNEIARALVKLLTSGPTTEDVIERLPVSGGRSRAEEWLLNGRTH